MKKAFWVDSMLKPAWWFLHRDKAPMQFLLIITLVSMGTIWTGLAPQEWGLAPAYGVYFFSVYLTAALFRKFKINGRRLGQIAASARQGNWAVGGLGSSAVWSERYALRLGSQMLQLRRMVKQSSEDLHRDSQAISKQTAQLSSNAEEIASMLEETASGMEQFAATIEIGSSNSRAAKDRAYEVSESAKNGAVNIGELIHALRESVEHSRRLSDIVAVIEEIANQTGMLALNAGIEAARAGDQGKGFATVAAEIRELSYRSSEASRDVKTLISSARSGMFQSVELAAKVETDIGSIVDRISEVTLSIADIANAAVEQQAGISQIKMTVEHMASLTQDNAAGVDSTARAALEMEGLAAALDTTASSITG